MSEVERQRRIAVVGGDLMALARIEAAAAKSSLEVQRLRPEALGSLDEPPGVELVVLDLDSGGRALIEAWAGLGETRPRAIGFFSHVDAELGEHARSRGVEALPRGRFWRALEEELAAL